MGVKVVKDLVHGYISIDESMQKCIDTDCFQRLHRVKQLTCNLLFPSVNHTRYEHSLGVMQLACDFIDTLASKFEKKGKSKEEIKLLRDHLSFAALLHDVGHPPFSHLGEKFLEKEEILEEIRNEVQGEFSIDTTFYQKGILQGSPHELLSCYSILHRFRDFLPSHLEADFLCRMIIGNPYEENIKWAENICIQILNSSTIDVDKLDYLMRDNHMTGQIAPLMDIKRFLESLSIDEENRLCFIAKAIPAVQSVVDSRDSLYLWVYHHHISVYTDFLLGEMLRDTMDRGILDRRTFFSPKAIVDNLIADDDVYSYLRGEYRKEKEKQLSSYFRKLSSQFFERDFLKSLWKTIYQYHDLEKDWLQNGIIPSVESLQQTLQKGKDWKSFTKKIQEDIGVEEGEIFLISQHHKFYHSMTSQPIEVVLDGKKRKLSDLLPQKNFEKFHQSSFFFYVREDKQEEAYQSFLKHIQKECNHGGKNEK